jgi:hypothetical protein
MQQQQQQLKGQQGKEEEVEDQDQEDSYSDEDGFEEEVDINNEESTSSPIRIKNEQTVFTRLNPKVEGDDMQKTNMPSSSASYNNIGKDKDLNPTALRAYQLLMESLSDHDGGDGEAIDVTYAQKLKVRTIGMKTKQEEVDKKKNDSLVPSNPYDMLSIKLNENEEDISVIPSHKLNDPNWSLNWQRGWGHITSSQPHQNGGGGGGRRNVYTDGHEVEESAHDNGGMIRFSSFKGE